MQGCKLHWRTTSKWPSDGWWVTLLLEQYFPLELSVMIKKKKVQMCPINAYVKCGRWGWRNKFLILCNCNWGWGFKFKQPHVADDYHTALCSSRIRKGFQAPVSSILSWHGTNKRNSAFNKTWGWKVALTTQNRQQTPFRVFTALKEARAHTHTSVSPVLVISLPRCYWCCQRSLWKLSRAMVSKPHSWLLSLPRCSRESASI